jgi:hypothetical protein
VCDCNYFACVIANRSYLWLQNLTLCVWLKATWLFGIWLQSWVVCDWKIAGSFVIAKTILCVSLQTLLVILWLQKKELNQWVFATILCAWLQPEVICGCKTLLCLCGWEATWLFGIWLQKKNWTSVWLQLFCVRDCKTWLCPCGSKLLGYLVYDCKKKNWTSVWLQLFCVRDCNQKLSVVAKPDCICVVESYLIIWYMIASLGSVWLQNRRVVCDCKNFFVRVIPNTAGYFMTAKKELK